MQKIRTKRTRAYPKEKLDEIDIIEHPNMTLPAVSIILFMIALIYLVFYIPQ